MSFLKSLARAAAVTLIAATGVGLLYLLAKTQIINEGFNGVSYDAGKLKVLKPGIHLLLSPLHVFDQQVPVEKDEVVSLLNYEIKTADSIPAMIQANFTYRVTDPEKAVRSVNNYKKAVQETVKSTISYILQHHRYDELTSAKISQHTSAFTGIDSKAESQELNNALPDPNKSIFADIKASLNETCIKWGILISNIQLVSVDTKDARISNEIAETSLSQLRASNQQIAANAKAQALIVESEAEASANANAAKGQAKAILSIAEAKIQAAQMTASTLKTPQQLEVYRLQMSLDAVRALSTTTGTLVFGNNNPFPLFSATNRRTELPVQGSTLPRSLSMNNLSTS